MPIRTIHYRPRVDAIRAILIGLLILASYGLPFPYAGHLTLLFNFARGALFALYGYYALLPGRPLRFSIFSTLRTLVIMLLVYIPVCVVYQEFVTGHALSWLNVPNALTFLIFNRWPIAVGSSIWMVLSVLYALLIFALFRWLPDNWLLDCIICAVLMLGGMVVGEFAAVFRLPFYLEANFLTLTIPYMLLGKILHGAPEKLRGLSVKVLAAMFFGGVLLCAAEIFVLLRTDTLQYYGHLFGFIPMTVSAVLLAARGPVKKQLDDTVLYLSNLYRVMFFVYNPIAEYYFAFAYLLVGFPTLYKIATGMTGLVTLALSFLLGRAVGRFRSKQVVIPDEHQ